MTRCTATAYGARCEMPAGHEGRHRGQIPNPHRPSPDSPSVRSEDKR